MRGGPRTSSGVGLGKNLDGIHRTRGKPRLEIEVGIDIVDRDVQHTYPYSSVSNSYARRMCGITMLPPTTSATLIASSCSARVTPRR